jgi:hypothetical protein
MTSDDDDGRQTGYGRSDDSRQAGFGRSDDGRPACWASSVRPDDGRPTDVTTNIPVPAAEVFEGRIYDMADECNESSCFSPLGQPPPSQGC